MVSDDHAACIDWVQQLNTAMAKAGVQERVEIDQRQADMVAWTVHPLPKGKLARSGLEALAKRHLGAAPPAELLDQLADE
jgi:hypothetical protein